MRNKKWFLILLALVTLLPYFLICFYAMPYADDFCMGWTASEKIPFIEKFLRQYYYWNGRYTSNLLSNLHPLITGRLILYQIALFTSLVLTLIAFYSLITQSIKGVYKSLVATFIIAMFYLCYMPDITEGAYWYIGIVNYQLGNVCFVFHVALVGKLLVPQSTKKVFLVPLALILLILSIGFNEIAATLIPSFYLLAVIVSYRLKISGRLFVGFFFIMAIVASAFVIFSPGNAVRSSEFPARFNLIHSLWYAALQTIRFISTWVLSVPFVGLSVLVIAYADKIKNGFIRQFDYRFILLLLLFTVFTGAFIPYFATGILGQHRTINYVFFYFILLWIGFLVSVSEKFSLLPAASVIKTGNRAFAIAVICIIFMCFSGTYSNIIFDISHHQFTGYRRDFMLRQAEIIANPDSPMRPLKNIPHTFKITDARRDSTWWVNTCIKKYYAETGLVLK